MLGSNFALLVKSPGDDGQQLLTTGSRLGMYIVEQNIEIIIARATDQTTSTKNAAAAAHSGGENCSVFVPLYA